MVEVGYDVYIYIYICLFEGHLVQLLLYCEFLNSSNYCIVGDFNANISNPDSYFSKSTSKLGPGKLGPLLR